MCEHRKEQASKDLGFESGDFIVAQKLHRPRKEGEVQCIHPHISSGCFPAGIGPTGL
jgi:hypothetical protein